MLQIYRFLTATGIACVALIASSSALACASCGCSLNADWGTQGMSVSGGWSLDVRADYLNQNQLRAGTGTISSTAAAVSTNTSLGGPAEVEKYTQTQALTATLDYNDGATWGVSVLTPYLSRSHSTLGVGSDGAAFVPANGAYQSQITGVGDVRVVGRYYGFTDQKNWGVQLGFKLPTGQTTQIALDGTTPVDPGLQLGTGTTDLILGAYTFNNLSQNWSYFGQTIMQTALNASNMRSLAYRPGNSLNVNFGLRYEGFESVTPSLQINSRIVSKDSGAAADTFSTGGTLLYLTPSLVIPMTTATLLYTSVQLPLYQKLNGIQLAPTYIFSAGVHISF